MFPCIFVYCLTVCLSVSSMVHFVEGWGTAQVRTHSILDRIWINGPIQILYHGEIGHWLHVSHCLLIRFCLQMETIDNLICVSYLLTDSGITCFF